VKEPARYDIDLAESWSILGKLHGGYLLARIVEQVLAYESAAGNRTTHPHPLATSATYVAAPSPGPATVVVQPLRTGRTVSTYHATLEQDGLPCVDAMATLGTLPAADAPVGWAAPTSAPPHIAPLEECVVPPPPLGTDRPSGLLDNVEMRLDPRSVLWATGEPSGDGECRGWLRMITPLGVVLDQFVMADAPPPATFDLGMYGWVPTLTLQVLLRRLPAPGWQRVHQRAQVVGDGLFDEDCTMWDEQGRTTVQARQLAHYRE
jgi:hypothetical protein